MQLENASALRARSSPPVSVVWTRPAVLLSHKLHVCTAYYGTYRLVAPCMIPRLGVPISMISATQEGVRLIARLLLI